MRWTIVRMPSSSVPRQRSQEMAAVASHLEDTGSRLIDSVSSNRSRSRVPPRPNGDKSMAKKRAAKVTKAKMLTWPNGKKVAVSVTVMFETSARRQRAELFGADLASEEGHRRSRRQGLVDLWRPGRRLADHANAGAARHSGDVLRQRPLHRAVPGRGQADQGAEIGIRSSPRIPTRRTIARLLHAGGAER